jgi:hypothetical protein
MAVKYVKDFKFPRSAGFTGAASANSWSYTLN